MSRWTEEQIAYLREHYPRMKAKDVAAALRRPVKGVGKKAESLGIRRIRGHSPEFLTGVLEMYASNDAKTVAAHYGVTVHAVRKWIEAARYA